MTTTLALDERLALTLSVPETEDGEPDAGVIRNYSIAPDPPGFDVMALRLVRLDTQESHRVGLDAKGRLRCSCRDRFYRPRRTGGCKHMRHCRPIFQLLAALVPTPPEPRPS